jgi:putative membrane protein
MKLHQTWIMIFGAAVLLSPTPLFAQLDPTAIPASSTQANQPQQQQPETSSMQDSGPNQGDVGQIMKDKMFLRSATQDGLDEIKLGQLAVEKSGSDDVKAFGQKMVDDHMKLNGELSSVADVMGVMLPKEISKDTQAEYDKLNGMSGTDFDTAYLTLMVKGHHRAMRDFRIEGNGVTDPALKQVVINGEGVIHEHLVQVDTLARAKGIPMPTRGGRPKPPPAS